MNAFTVGCVASIRSRNASVSSSSPTAARTSGASTAAARSIVISAPSDEDGDAVHLARLTLRARDGVPHAGPSLVGRDDGAVHVVELGQRAEPRVRPQEDVLDHALERLHAGAAPRQ